MKVHRYLLPALVIISLLGGVGIGMLSGDWITSGKGMVVVDAAGKADPAGIKGSMTLQFVSDTFGIPLDELYLRIQAPADLTPTTQLKELEDKIPGFEVSAVREQVAEYQKANP